MALLEVENLRVHFPVKQGLFARTTGQVKAVDNVSFTVGPGEAVGLVGESGCGKTTLGRAVLRLIEPTSGRVAFNGEDIGKLSATELRARRRQFQMIFQDPFGSLNPRMTVSDIIGEALDIHGLAGTREERGHRIRQLLHGVGLEPEYALRYPHEFSGGQRQRIAIARALVLRPRLMVLDEPVSALDVSIRAQILNLLMDLQDQFGLSYLLISHDLDVIAEMCAEIAVMYLGQIVEIGPARDIVANPRHPYTQALFSARLPAHPDGAASRIRLTGEIPSPLDPPSGCRFRTRCPHAMPICAERLPSVCQLPNGQRAACHLLDNLSS